MIDIRLPNITGKTEVEQLVQVKSYLHQLAEQLNWALNNIESVGVQTNVSASTAVSKAQENSSNDDPIGTFNSVKGLIIKSADIVNAYYEEINTKLEGVYVAEANFPEGSAKFIQKTTKDTTETSEKVSTLFTNTQTIESNVKSINNVLQPGEDCTKILGASAWVNIGLVGYDDKTGFPIYGMEVGQVNEEDGVEVYRRFAQYRSDGVHLFDQNEIEVVELSSSRMIIKTSANFQGSITHGGFTDYIQPDKSVVTKWTGGV